MTNKLEIDRELLANFIEYSSPISSTDQQWHRDKQELRAILAQAEMWNPHPAEAHLASLLIVLGSAGIKVSGGTHGDPWTVAAPVVERQEPVADDLKAFEFYWYAQKTTSIGSTEALKHFNAGVTHARQSLRGQPIAYWYQHAPDQDPGLCFFPTATVPGGLVKPLYTSPPAPVAVVERQYYYRMDACKVNDSADPDCKCWHDEGTGPLFNKFSTIEPKSWRPKP